MSVNYQKAFLAPMLEKESDDDNDNSIQSKPINYFNTNSSMLNETRILNHPTIFLYKGVGFSFVKSFRSLQSFGMNLKVPITTHFPQYDRRQYLPRVGASIGMYFPIDYKCTFSFSIPILTAFYGKYTLKLS